MKSILDKYIQEYFEIKKIINYDSLLSCHKTSFVWSKSPQTLCLAANRYYFTLAINNPNILGIITPPATWYSQNDSKTGIIIAKKADELFYHLHNKGIHSSEAADFKDIERQGNQNGNYIAPTANIDPSAKLGKNVWIGDNVTIHSGVIILDNCTIMRNSVLHPYVTVGTEGFFSKYVMGKKIHIRHFGGVEIGENCIIHTGTNISRSVNFSENTIISDNVHIGIHTNIGHDCHVGADTDISAKVLIAGRAQIGKNCWIGANVTISNALSIGSGSKIFIGSVVISDVPDHATISGNFAVNHSDNLRRYLQKK